MLTMYLQVNFDVKEKNSSCVTRTIRIYGTYSDYKTYL